MEYDICVDRKRIKRFIERDEYNVCKYVVERLKRENINLGGAVNINNVYIEDYIVSNNT